MPASLDWETWLATAEERDYNVGYMNGEWRSWFDLGNGALGDWGAHIFDTAHEFLTWRRSLREFAPLRKSVSSGSVVWS